MAVLVKLHRGVDRPVGCLLWAGCSQGRKGGEQPFAAFCIEVCSADKVCFRCAWPNGSYLHITSATNSNKCDQKSFAVIDTEAHIAGWHER